MPKTHIVVRNEARQTIIADEVRLADGHWTRLKGLIGTPEDQFQQGKGLLIKPCRGVHSMMMGFSIDAIYLDEDHRIIHIEHNLAPWKLAPMKSKAAAVLEVPADIALKTRCQVGDQLQIVASPMETVSSARL